MTDRGRDALGRSREALTIGPSSMRWDGTRLTIDIDEVSSLPLVSRMRGRIVLTPTAVTSVELALTPDGAHIWRPFAPTADIAVELEAPGWQWSGHGYLDANFGLRALETDFSYWTWGRFPTEDGSLCFYDARRRDGTALAAATAFGRDGGARPVDAPPAANMARTAWRLRREARADPGTVPRQVRPMLDAPFYSRSVVRTQIDGRALTGVHEALDLDRFSSPWLKPMLAMRVPRRRRWRDPMK